MTSWQTLKVNGLYEINVEYPHQIRKRTNDQKVISEYIDSGKATLKLEGKKYRKDKIVAIQFIPNPDNLPYVIHINNDKADSHIENLKWSNTVGHKTITKYKGKSCRFINENEIPKGAIPITHYFKYKFKDCYYYDNTFFQLDYNDNYKVLHWHERKDGSPNLRVYLRDVDKVGRPITKYAFERIYQISH